MQLEPVIFLPTQYDRSSDCYDKDENLDKGENLDKVEINIHSYWLWPKLANHSSHHIFVHDTENVLSR